MSAMDVKMIRRRKASDSGVRTNHARSARDTGGASNDASARSARFGATLEHQTLGAGLSQVRGVPEPFGNAPDDNRVHRRHGADPIRPLDKGIAAWLRPSFSPVRKTVSRQRLRALEAVPTRPPLQSRSASRVANTASRRWRSRFTASTAATSNRSWPTRSDASPSTSAPYPAKVRPADSAANPISPRKDSPAGPRTPRRPPAR